ncbi:TPA: hypothetical protein N0F65_008430 [Lagenidium giganteum]|uniref:Calcineurin-like phosphoesterase domain-containing protein n=1 Tax=Lagenidium giganteum TaxID=4803 RepID=A0AAV2YS91_9STRA|nr:TPA: hypothetical protein N0F65_008430 [Lagenidium giganteum]
MANRKWLIVAVVVVLGVVGAVVFVVTNKKSTTSITAKDAKAILDNSKNNSSSSSPGTVGPHKGSSKTSTSGSSKSSSGSKSSGNSTKTDNSTDLVDPTTDKFTLSAFAIGDWGATVYKDSCCVRRGDYTAVDRHAEEAVGKLMGIVADAADVKPKVVMGHGDNFYWLGIMSPTDMTYRFENTFESKYDAKSLKDIPWVNVMGNHDYGGASYVCSNSDGPVECSSTDELITALKNKFKWQSEYKSPNNNRWIMKDHFYTYSIQDEASGVSIDIFNLDTNDADTHGASQICCQCYGYSNGKKGVCEEVTRGNKYCAGGDNSMYDTCMKQLQDWADDSKAQLVKEVKASKATWKIVNTHYSPYNHYAPHHADSWKETLDGLGVQLWINGHTHGEKHDYGKFGMHFIENGAGGGIQNESPSGIPPYAESYIEKVWTAGNYPYGFFDLTASKNWLKVRFLTMDDKWKIEEDKFDEATIGGAAVKHCWYIPKDGTKGQSCDD